MWKDFANLNAALPTALELERRAHQVPGLPLRAKIASGNRLPVVFIEQGLRVEGIHLRHAAIHEKEYHALGPGREVRGLGRQG